MPPRNATHPTNTMEKKSSNTESGKKGQPGTSQWVNNFIGLCHRRCLLTTAMMGQSDRRSVHGIKEMVEAAKSSASPTTGTLRACFPERSRQLALGQSQPQLQVLYAGADASMNIPDGEAYQTDLKELQERHG